MDYRALVAELRDDPLARGYADMDDAARMAALSALDRSRPRRLSSLDLLLWGGAAGRLARIRKAAQKAAPYEALPDEAHAVAIVADALVTRQDAGFDPALLAHVAMLDALVAASVLSAADRTALLALASEPCSRASELGLAGLGRGHLASARSEIGGG